MKKTTTPNARHDFKDSLDRVALTKALRDCVESLSMFMDGMSNANPAQRFQTATRIHAALDLLHAGQDAAFTESHPEIEDDEFDPEIVNGRDCDGTLMRD